MPRPLRYDVPTVRRVLYVHPDTGAVIDAWTAGGHGRTPGQYLDLLVRRSQPPPEAKEAVPSTPSYGLAQERRSPNPTSLKAEGWTVDPQSGDFVPPPGMSEEEAKTRFRQEAGRLRAPGTKIVAHKPRIINGGLTICDGCSLPKTRWAVSCPGAST